MSKTRRPPDILRKSHPHLDVDERAKLKRELFDALDEAADDDDEASVPDEPRAADAPGRDAGDER